MFEVSIFIHMVLLDLLALQALENIPWGSRDGAVARALASHQYGTGSILGLGVICGLSLLLVLVPAPSSFSLGTPVFPSPQKNQHF